MGLEALLPLSRDGVPLWAASCTDSNIRRRVLGPEKYEVITAPPLKSLPKSVYQFRGYYSTIFPGRSLLPAAKNYLLGVIFFFLSFFFLVSSSAEPIASVRYHTGINQG